MEGGKIIVRRYYICSPLRAADPEKEKQNAKYARSCMYYIQRILDEDIICFAPHGVLYGYLDDSNPKERELALRFGLDYLALCEALIICSETISEGMKAEIKMARELGIPIYKLRLFVSAEELINHYRMENRTELLIGEDEIGDLLYLSKVEKENDNMHTV